jgi:hypothetical protein
LYKGSVDDKIVKALTAAPRVRDLVVTVEAGASKIKALVAADIKVGAYFKTGGAHDPAGGDKRDAAVWAAAKSMLWTVGAELAREPNQGWFWADLQRYAEAWADKVVIPRIAARLADAPGVSVAMLDNFGAVWPGNLSPTPPDFDPARYLAACEVVLSRCKAAFPHLAFLPNGYNDWNPAGLRGESVLDDVSYLWAEGFRAKVGGTIYDAARLHERLRTFSWMDEDRGVGVVAHDYFAPTDYGKRLSTLAAFLVCSGPRSLLHLDGTTLGWATAEQEIAGALGSPEGCAGLVGQVLVRRYELGLAAINVSGTGAAFDCAAWSEARIGASGVAWAPSIARVLAHGEGVVVLT